MNRVGVSSAIVIWSVLAAFLVAQDVRKWTDSTGKHQIEAQFVEFVGWDKRGQERSVWMREQPLEKGPFTQAEAERVPPDVVGGTRSVQLLFPNGDTSQSPGLPRSGYPGYTAARTHNPKGVVSWHRPKR